MTIRETILALHSIEDRAKDFPTMTDCDWVAIAAAKRHLLNGLLPEIVSESIINEFMNTLTFTYDKSEKCMVAKIYNSDLTSLKDIIESKPTPMDVYQGKTTLEYTIRDGKVIDSVVVWK